MAQRYIYLPDDLNNKLKEEKNVSALIVKLLFDYYKFNTHNLEEINHKISGAKELIKQKTDTIESEIEKLERLKNQIELEEKERIELEDRYKTKEGKFRTQFFKNFKDITNQETNEETYLKFKLEWDRHETGFNIFKFIEELEYAK